MSEGVLEKEEEMGKEEWEKERIQWEGGGEKRGWWSGPAASRGLKSHSKLGKNEKHRVATVHAPTTDTTVPFGEHGGPPAVTIQAPVARGHLWKEQRRLCRLRGMSKFKVEKGRMNGWQQCHNTRDSITLVYRTIRH